MAIATGPDEVAHVQIALLGQHVREQGVAGDVEGHAEKNVGAALVELARQLVVGDVELEQGVAGHQGHLGQLGHVPGADDDAARVAVRPELLDNLGDLINGASRRRPRAPLHPVDRAEVAVGLGPLVPNRHATFLQPGGVAVATQEPQQLEDDGLEVHLLGRHQGEAFGEVEAHLVAEHAARSGAGAVGLFDAVLEHMAHEIFVLRSNRAGHFTHYPGRRKAPDRTASRPAAHTSRRVPPTRHGCRCRRSGRGRARRCGRRVAPWPGGGR